MSPKLPDRLAVQRGAVGLRAVLEHHEVMPPRDIDDRADVAGRAAHVDVEHGLAVRPDLAFQIDRRHVETVVDVHQARDGPQPHDPVDAARPEVAGDQHLVAGAHVHGGQRDVDRLGAAADRQRVVDAIQLTEPRLQLVAHVLDVGAVKAEGGAGLDHLGDLRDLLLVEPMDARRLGRQGAGADGRAPVDCQGVGLHDRLDRYSHSWAVLILLR